MLIPETMQLIRIERKNGITIVAYFAGNLGVPINVRGATLDKGLDMVIKALMGDVSNK
nr:hypothetical protein [Shewanella glacialipiscicola]